MQTQLDQKQLDTLIQECVTTGRFSVMQDIAAFLRKPETKTKLAEFMADPSQGKYISEYLTHLILEKIK